MSFASQKKVLFPTQIWMFDLGSLSSHFPLWTEEINLWRAQEPEPQGRSNRRGWNSPLTVFSRKEFEPLKIAATQCFEQAMKEMQPTSKMGVMLEAWVNMHDYGAYNTMHLHPGCLLSGCFYLQVPEEAGPIVFRDPRPGVLMSSFPGKGINCKNDIALSPRAGQLVLFPHWLEHRVESNNSMSSRLSIAINAVRTSAAAS